MYRLLSYAACAVTCISLLGCAMCCGPYDDHYNVYGGKFQRVDPAQGRVGSVLSDPAFMGSGPAADSNLDMELAPSRSTADPESTGAEDPDPSVNTDEDTESIREELQRIREEMNLRGGGNNETLPAPNRPQPDQNNNAGPRDTNNQLRPASSRWR